MAAVSIDGLTKEYGDIVANDEVTFDVERGEIFGYLGPNGAGKTTTIRMLLGLIYPTAGTAEVLGADIRNRKALTAVKQDIGYLPDTLGFDERRTGNEVLNYFAGMRGDHRREELLELFTPPLEQRVETFSAGNRRMLGIVQAFMHDPEFVIMDEPTSGLDPLKQDRLHAFIENERDQGTTFFISSHVLSEVQRVCDRVGIIRQGELVTLEDVEGLLQRSGKEVWVRLTEPIERETFVTDDMIDVEIVEDSIHFTYTGETMALLEHLVGFDVEDTNISNPQLETIFKHHYREELQNERS